MNVPVMIGGIEASLRRIAHMILEALMKVPPLLRLQVLIDPPADIMLYGNAERDTHA